MLSDEGHTLSRVLAHKVHAVSLSFLSLQSDSLQEIYVYIYIYMGLCRSEQEAVFIWSSAIGKGIFRGK